MWASFWFAIYVVDGGGHISVCDNTHYHERHWQLRLQAQSLCGIIFLNDRAAYDYKECTIIRINLNKRWKELRHTYLLGYNFLLKITISIFFICCVLLAQGKINTLNNFPIPQNKSLAFWTLIFIVPRVGRITLLPHRPPILLAWWSR